MIPMDWDPLISVGKLPDGRWSVKNERQIVLTPEDLDQIGQSLTVWFDAMNLMLGER